MKRFLLSFAIILLASESGGKSYDVVDNAGKKVGTLRER